MTRQNSAIMHNAIIWEFNVIFGTCECKEEKFK